MSVVVDTKALRNSADTANQIGATVGRSREAVRMAKNSLPPCVLNKRNLYGEFAAVQTSMSNAQTRIYNIASFLDSTADIYDNVEKELENKKEVIDTTIKIVGKFGQVGMIAAFVMNITKPGAFSEENRLGLLKAGASTIKGIADWAKSEKGLQTLSHIHSADKVVKKTRGDRLVGWNQTLKSTPSQASSVSTRAYNNYQKYLAEKGGPFDSFTSGGAKSALAWTGLILTGAANGLSNYQEYKSGEISAGRAVAETVTETTIDIVKDWAIGAAVTVGMLTVCGSAPVVLVGVASVAVSAGLDWASKKITGAIFGEEKGFTEAASDLILNAAGAVAKGAKKITSGISKIGSSISKSIGRGFKSLFA